MSVCPVCKSNLTQAELDLGRCASCQHPLGEAIAPGGAAPPAGEAEGGKMAIPLAEDQGGSKWLRPAARAFPPRRQRPLPAMTFRAASRGRPRRPSQRHPGEVPAPRMTGASKRHSNPSALPPPAFRPFPPLRLSPAQEPDRAKGTADEIAATFAPGSLPESVVPGSPSKAESHRFAETIERGGLPPEVAERVSLLWSGKYDSSATPRSSIKSDASGLEEESRLVIQPRVICDAMIASTMHADYELIEQLGEGGMGVVMAARQASIDRTVALKRIKPAEARKAENRQKFLAEAIVTGELEHPNIVPIYDLGKDESGTLFYAMKHVTGTPWSQVIRTKGLQENLEIWMKVADAVAFAHSRGVIHRDLKPENVMLGGFGEVLVMDWGLAVTVSSPTARMGGIGGTPAYMAPEMAVGPMDRIRFASDVYLLGAILYEIVTGKTPHSGATVTACLMAVAGNVIQPSEKRGELVDIAMKAMAGNPRDRYASVGDLQEALRQYQSHAQSVLLSERAEKDLAKARASENYEYYARAQFGFQEAFSLWEGNGRAKAGIAEAILAYAGQALKNGDYEMGVKLLNAEEPAHAPLLKQIRAGQQERETRVRRLKTARRIGVALLLIILAGGSVAFISISAETQKALAAKKYAEAQKEEADRQRKVAVDAETAAVKAKDAEAASRKKAQYATADAVVARNDALTKKKEADAAKNDAVAAKNDALDQKKKADHERDRAVEAKTREEKAKEHEAYRGYIARIGLASAKIEENAFDRAKTLLEDCPDEFRDWEWRRLMYVCTQGSRKVDAVAPIEALAFTHDGKYFASGGWGGTVQVWETSSGKLRPRDPVGRRLRVCPGLLARWPRSGRRR